MQAVLLAAGSSTRTYPLTVNKPKPLLKVANKTILEHNLEQLSGLIDEAILIVGFKGNLIKEFLKSKKYPFKITFVEQKKQLGTGDAVLKAKALLKGTFIVMGADDLFSKKDIQNCLKQGLAVLAQETNTPEMFGTLKTKGKYVVEIVEKSKNPPSKLVNTGLYVFNKKIFDIQLKRSKRGEYEITDYVKELAKKEKIAVVKVEKYWLSIAYPWDLLNANEFLLKDIKKEIKGEIEKGCTLKGNVVVGKGTVVKSGAYIEGPVVIGENCSIGPNCYIRASTSIGDNCKVGQAVEIKNSLLMNNTKVPHLSYVGDSVIAENVNFGAGTIAANLRHDNQNIKSAVKGILIDTGRRKLGTIIGENSKLGINTAIYPGRKIWPDKQTAPGEVVKEDIV